MTSHMLALLLAFAACSGEHRAQPTESDRKTTTDALAARLATVGKVAEAPEPTPQLPAGTALSSVNTLVLTEAELAAKKFPPAPGALAFVAVSRERAVYTMSAGSQLARNVVSIWDLDARRWIGSLWVTVDYTPATSREMVQVRNGKEFGPSFIEHETPAQLAARHAETLRAATDEALTTRTQVWKAWSLRRPPFDPARLKTYAVAAPADRPARGAADAKAVVQMFVQLGNQDDTLRVAQITQAYGDRVRIVARNRTLDSQPGSDLAAQASLEVFAQAGAPAFWRYTEALAALPRRGSQGPVLDVQVLLDAAAALGGIDAAKLRTAIEKRTHAAEISADMAALRTAGLDKRTTIWLIGGWLMEWSDWATYDGAIQATLAR